RDRHRSHDHHQDRNHHRHDWPVDEKFRHDQAPFAVIPLAPEPGACSFGFTTEPSRTFCNPSTITISPGFTPSCTIHCSPTRSPTFTDRMLTLFPSPTTAT